MHELIHANAPFLFAWMLASVGVVAIALVIEPRVRASAATRHVLMFAALLLPFTLPGWRLAVDGWRWSPAQPRGAEVVAAWWSPANRQPATANPTDLPCALLAFWAAGSILALLRTARDAQRWRDARKRATPVNDRAMPVDHPVEISDACREPAVAGILDPTILLPAGGYLDALTGDELEAVLAHELEHVRRRDNLRAFIVQLICTFFWFSPVHRAARRRLVELRERACDDAVLARGCQPDSYLSALAKSCESSLQSTAVSCMSRLQLRERMESIMTFESQSPRAMSWAARLGLAAAACVVATAFAFFAPSPSLQASSTTSGPYAAEVWVRPASDGRWVATIKLDAPGGPFTSVAVMESLPDDRTVTNEHGGRTYKVTMHTNSDASGSADVEVREGDVVVWSAARTFAAPAPRVERANDGKYSRVGGDVKPPKVLHRAEPNYPAEA
jgi:beta-lactamase regulating signal transducer with metallopeptidase domain